MTKITYFIFTFLLFLSASLYAQNSSLLSFYTDDSSYYQKLYSDGVEMRFRINRTECDQLESAKLIFQSKREEYFQKINDYQNEKEMKEWKDLFGIDEKNYCWFKIKVEGLDLNNPKENRYLIQLNLYDSRTSLYFSGLTNSLLPQKRIVNSLSNVEWISFGAMGATPVEDGGVFFKIWEPEADRVDLLINGKDLYELNDDSSKNNFMRSHSIYIKDASEGDSYQYKFMKGDDYEMLEVANHGYMSPIKVDPMARKLTYDAKGGYHNGYLNPKAIIEKNNDKFSWKNDSKVSSKIDNWIIYQIWPLTFNPLRSTPGNFKSINSKIDYIKDLGVSAVELLPVHESRFHGSWGYALDSLLLIENNYGDKRDLKRLVDNFHREGLRVLFDVVLNHVNNTLIRDPLTPVRSKTKFYSGNTAWGPKPDFKSIMVRKWIMDSLLELMREFHLDGFRFDMTERIYNSNHEGYLLLQELNTLFKIENPNFFSAAEELPDNVWATFPVEQNGMAFDAQWNDRFKNFFEHEFNNYRDKNRYLDLNSLRSSLLGFSNHMSGGTEYHFGPPLRTVNYLGSHDFIGNKDPFIRIVSDYRSFEYDAHNTISRVRPLEDPDQPEMKFRLIHNNFTHGITRLAYGILFSKPGSSLFFQGEELASDINIENEWSYLAARNNNSIPTKNINLTRYVGSHRMPWEYLTLSSELDFLSEEERNLFSGHHLFFKEMIRFKNENSSISKHNASNVHIFDNHSLITYELQSDSKKFFVVANFGDKRKDLWLDFPERSHIWWQERINTSEKRFGGVTDAFKNIITNRGGRKNLVRMEGPSLIIFEGTSSPNISEVLYLRGSFNDWSAHDSHKLVKRKEGSEFSTFLEVKYPGNYEFKLGTADWTIELGCPVFYKDHMSDDPSNKLTYRPSAPNAKIWLDAGFYQFNFDANTFKYYFEKLNR